jgi:hypothetical protein
MRMAQTRTIEAAKAVCPAELAYVSGVPPGFTRRPRIRC